MLRQELHGLPEAEIPGAARQLPDEVHGPGPPSLSNSNPYYNTKGTQDSHNNSNSGCSSSHSSSCSSSSSSSSSSSGQ